MMLVLGVRVALLRSNRDDLRIINNNAVNTVCERVCVLR